MRPKIEGSRKHKARGVSLPPKMHTEALRRCAILDVSFSKYVQKLIALDIERQLLRALAV